MKAKLSYVAYFHNISLKNEDFMKIKTMEELKAADLQKSEDEMILNHAHLSASIVEKFPMVPEGVGTIIKEHHGAKNGVGFPESLSICITPLSMMFLVVEDFVDEFLKVSEKPTKDDFERIFTKLNTRYTKLTYAQALNALIDMIYKKNS